MILRASFANITPRALAERVQAAGLSGSVFWSLGAGIWGIERGATVEFAFRRGADRTGASRTSMHEAFVRAVLVTLNEQASYVTAADTDGTRAFLYWQDGRVERLDA
jgi:Na+-driven multidrug efflux pump